MLSGEKSTGRPGRSATAASAARFPSTPPRAACVAAIPAMTPVPMASPTFCAAVGMSPAWKAPMASPA